MKQKSVKTAYRREFRRQFNDKGEALPPPATTFEEDNTLIMVIDGVRHVGKRDKLRGFFWVPEGGEG